MAVVGAYQVQCPECGIALPVGVALGSPTHEGDHLIVNVEPELTDVVAHVWTHQVDH